MKLRRTMALLGVFAMLLGLCACGREAASIGIIGGADGPTAIFVTGPDQSP